MKTKRNVMFRSEDVQDDINVTAFSTPFNYQYNKERGAEPIDPVSVTVPDQSLTIHEIMRRHLQGRPIEVNNKLTYTGGEVLYPDVRKMDLVDIDELKEKVDNQIKDINYELKNKSDENKAKAAEKEKEDAEVRQGRRYVDQPLPFEEGVEGGSGGTAQQVPPDSKNKNVKK